MPEKLFVSSEDAPLSAAEWANHKPILPQRFFATLAATLLSDTKKDSNSATHHKSWLTQDVLGPHMKRMFTETGMSLEEINSDLFEMLDVRELQRATDTIMQEKAHLWGSKVKEWNKWTSESLDTTYYCNNFIYRLREREGFLNQKWYIGEKEVRIGREKDIFTLYKELPRHVHTYIIPTYRNCNDHDVSEEDIICENDMYKPFHAFLASCILIRKSTNTQEFLAALDLLSTSSTQLSILLSDRENQHVMYELQNESIERKFNDFLWKTFIEFVRDFQPLIKKTYKKIQKEDEASPIKEFFWSALTLYTWTSDNKNKALENMKRIYAAYMEEKSVVEETEV